MRRILLLLLVIGMTAVLPCCHGHGSSSSSSTSSSLALPTFWDSHMVLQREPMAAHIWGWASPGANVTVTLTNTILIMMNNITTDDVVVATAFSIASSSRGIWSLDLPPQKAGSGYTLHISDGGHRDIVLDDIAFGDVFLCSGQSNMQMSVPATFNATAEIADSIHYPNLRLATVDLVTADTPQDDAPSKANYTWARSSPAAINGNNGFGFYSATCYYFGRELYQHFEGKVPIGLVTSCWGGQTVETFSSIDALKDKTCGGTRPQAGEWEDYENNELLASDDDSSQGPRSTQLWNAMIHPLRTMRFTGAIWYQGEANAGNPASYACRFPAMISDWRNKFNLPELSFFFVQLAGYPQPNHFENIRAAQMAAKQLPQVGYATAIDLGDPSSTSGAIHPRRKQEVGRRLSLAVRAIQYGERGLVYTGPVLNAVQIIVKQNGDSGGSSSRSIVLRLGFEPGTADGLHFHGSPECIACCSQELPFQVLNSSGKWIRVDAAAKFRGTELYLAATSSSDVDTTVFGIRYAWEGYPQCHLYNGAAGGPDDHRGIAAAPFEWCAYPSGNSSWTDHACLVVVPRKSKAFGGFDTPAQEYSR
jgi:sialate O-acetylesterase